MKLRSNTSEVIAGFNQIYKSTPTQVLNLTVTDIFNVRSALSLSYLRNDDDGRTILRVMVRTHNLSTRQEAHFTFILLDNFDQLTPDAKLNLVIHACIAWCAARYACGTLPLDMVTIQRMFVDYMCSVIKSQNEADLFKLVYVREPRHLSTTLYKGAWVGACVDTDEVPKVTFACVHSRFKDLSPSSIKDYIAEANTLEMIRKELT